MNTNTIVEKIEAVASKGDTSGHPWLVIKFRNLWEAGLDKVGGHQLEIAMQRVLERAGICLMEGTNEDGERKLNGYVNFVSAKGATIYVGNVEPEQWAEASADHLADVMREVIANN